MQNVTNRMALLGLALALLLAHPSAAQDESQVRRETRLHDVSDLRPVATAPLRPTIGDAGLFRAWASSPEFDEFAEQVVADCSTTEPSLSDIASLLSSLVCEVDEEGDVGESAGRIAVESTAEGQERAEAGLAILRRAAGSPFAIEIEELELPADAALVARPDAAAVAAWRASDVRGASRVLSLSLDAGRWSVAQDISAVRGVVDLDVEIAQDASIADPVVTSVETGLRVFASARPLTDGRVVLQVLAGAAELRGPLRRVAIGRDQLGTVDLADIEGAFVATEVVLTAGVAQTLVADRPDGAKRVLVLRLREAAAPPVSGTLRFLPIGALTTQAPDVRFVVGGDPWMDGRPAFALEDHDSEGASRLDGDLVREQLEQELVDELEEGTAEVSSLDWLLGGSLAMRAGADALDRAEERLRRLEAQAVRPVRLTLRFEERAPDARAGRTVGTLASPVALDQAVALGAYRNMSFVADQDVEVAEKAQISDPLVGSVVAGLLANVVVTGAGEGAYSVAVEMRASSFAEPRMLAITAANVGSIEDVASRSLYSTAHVRVGAGGHAEVLLGNSPFGGKPGTRLVCVIGVE